MGHTLNLFNLATNDVLRDLRLVAVAKCAELVTVLSAVLFSAAKILRTWHAAAESMGGHQS